METHAVRSIRHCLDMIAPFEASDRQREEGQRQFYDFMVSIYRGMYGNPLKYLVFPAPYEEYIARCGSQAVSLKKEKEHVSDSRESTLRNTFQQAIQFYGMFFYYVGVQCEGLCGSSGALVISPEEYAGVLGRLNRLHDAKYNEERYQVLSGLGIEIHEEGGMIHIAHREFTHAMEGLLYLCKAPDSKYKWMNFLRLDYRNAYAPVPAVEDICRTLPEGSRAIVRKLEKHLAGMKVRARIKPLRGIVSDFKWKVEYSYKSKNICGFYADSGYFMLCIYFNHFQNITDFAAVLQEEDRELAAWFREQFPERLCRCPSNRRVYFGGEARRICGLSNRAEVVNPGDGDLEKALYILRRYRNLP